MTQVVIVDSRPDWMKAEDRMAACMRCSLFKKCSSRFGYECKKLGGSEIPKIRGGSPEKEKTKPRYRKGKTRRLQQRV
jgi:hypothetical protein